LQKHAELNLGKDVKDSVARKPDPMRIRPDMPASKAVTLSVILLLIAGVAISAAVERDDRTASNWPRANCSQAPSDKAFEKFTPRELIPYVMGDKCLKGADYEYPRGMRLACAWFCWKTGGKGGTALRKALSDTITAMLSAVRDDPKRSLHDCSLWAGFLGPLQARQDIGKLLMEVGNLDCCYGPALVRALGQCGDLRDVPFLIDTVIDKESEACAGIVHEVLVKLTRRSAAPRAKGYTDKDDWRKWWGRNAKRLLRLTTRPAACPATRPATRPLDHLPTVI